MQTTYVPSSNTATNGVAIGSAEQDIRIYQLIIGAPVAAGNITLYNITNPINGSTANIAAKWTLPASLPTTGASLNNTLNFGALGFPLPQGGNIIIDQSMQVTVVWALADNSQK